VQYSVVVHGTPADDAVVKRSVVKRNERNIINGLLDSTDKRAMIEDVIHKSTSRKRWNGKLRPQNSIDPLLTG